MRSVVGGLLPQTIVYPGDTPDQILTPRQIRTTVVQNERLAMASTRNIVRVFLASPGDLAEERRVAKDAVEEFNDNHAEFLNYQIELLGWEDTVTQQGRAQEVINRELLKCDLFIGIIWKRWGTPPAKGGPYTSGFQEEFTLATETYHTSGRPDLKLFFKAIDADALVDPGEGLKKVLEFQKKIIDDKDIYFESFNGLEEFRKRFARAITSYIQELYEKDTARPAAASTATAPVEASKREEAPLEAAFLEAFAGDLSAAEDDSIDAGDVARLRTIASSLARGGNDQMYVGVHDANLMFGQRKSVELSYGERRILVDTALANHANQNAPLFHWLATWDRDLSEYLSLTAYVGSTEPERVGAIEVMRLLGLPFEHETARDHLRKSLMGATAPAAVKVAMLRYLEVLGTRQDLPTIQEELDRSNYATVRTALRAAVVLRLADDIHDARTFLLSAQLESVDYELVDAVFPMGSSVSVVDARLGLGHRSPAIRKRCFEILSSRSALSKEDIDSALSDDDGDIRLLGMRSSVINGRTFDAEEARKVLVRPRSSGAALGLFRRRQRDEKGERNLEEFLRFQFQRLSKGDLERLADLRTPNSFDPYFVLAEKYFSEFSPSIRAMVDGRCEREFDEFIGRVKQTLSIASYQGTLLSDYQKLSDHFKRRWTRLALDVLAVRGDTSDLSRFRRNIEDGYVTLSGVDLSYFKKYGSEQDIALISKSVSETNVGLTILTMSDEYSELMQEAAGVIVKLSRGKVKDLLNMSLSGVLLEKIIRLLSKREVSVLTDSVLRTVLLHENDSVRRAMVLRVVATLPAKRVAALLKQYETVEKTRYYNVVYWLDLGVSFPVKRAQLAAGRALGQS